MPSSREGKFTEPSDTTSRNTSSPPTGFSPLPSHHRFYIKITTPTATMPDREPSSEPEDIPQTSTPPPDVFKCCQCGGLINIDFVLRGMIFL
ncbi:hypothetical protein B0T18DRAFT_18794 [Schizothecium vesticola]|uniref:Uncharacterized protein n=1 Tax=Schizothecium vesticola TaxID=314040 RepID=A0AA40F9I7_9PEZI|nr:hypothetical protein B0T18DRAFT_18794 [Schizothecium vesticola]